MRSRWCQVELLWTKLVYVGSRRHLTNSITRDRRHGVRSLGALPKESAREAILRRVARNQRHATLRLQRVTSQGDAQTRSGMATTPHNCRPIRATDDGVARPPPPRRNPNAIGPSASDDEAISAGIEAFCAWDQAKAKLHATTQRREAKRSQAAMGQDQREALSREAGLGTRTALASSPASATQCGARTNAELSLPLLPAPAPTIRWAQWLPRVRFGGLVCGGSACE